MRKGNLDKLIAVLKELDDAYVILEEVYDDEEYEIDSRSDRWKESEKGEDAQNDLYTVSEIRDSLESVKDEVENFLSNHDIDPFA